MMILPLFAVSLAVVAFYHFCWGHTSKKFTLSGRWVIVAGAAGGLGTELCKELLKRGARLICVDNNDQRLKRLKFTLESLEQFQSGTLFYKYDVSNRHAAELLVREIDSQLKPANARVSVIINSCGMLTGLSLTDWHYQSVIRSLESNFLTQANLSMAYLATMLRDGDGYIVNVSSLMAFMGGSRIGLYAASKAASVAFTKSIRQEIKKFEESPQSMLFSSNFDSKDAVVPRLHEGVHAMSVCPYLLDSSMFSGVMQERNLIAKLRNLLFPALRCEYVASRIISSIESCESLLALPLVLYYAIQALNFIPTCLSDWILAKMGGMHGMDTWQA